MLHIFPMEANNGQCLTQRWNVHLRVNDICCTTWLTWLASTRRRLQCSCLVVLAMLFDQIECIFHANEHQRLHEKALVQSEWNRRANHDHFCLLLEDTLLQHFVQLLPLSEDFVLAKKTYEFTFWNFIFLFSVKGAAPNILNKLFILPQRVPQASLILRLSLIVDRHSRDASESTVSYDVVVWICFLFFVPASRSLALFEAINHLRSKILWHLTVKSRLVEKMFLVAEPWMFSSVLNILDHLMTIRLAMISASSDFFFDLACWSFFCSRGSFALVGGDRRLSHQVLVFYEFAYIFFQQQEQKLHELDFEASSIDRLEGLEVDSSADFFDILF